jgi:hypothetical protein
MIFVRVKRDDGSSSYHVRSPPPTTPPEDEENNNTNNPMSSGLVLLIVEGTHACLLRASLLDWAAFDAAIQQQPVLSEYIEAVLADQPSYGDAQTRIPATLVRWRGLLKQLNWTKSINPYAPTDDDAGGIIRVVYYSTTSSA